MEKELKQFGLSQNAISVFLSLLQIGETAVGNIIKETKLHRQSAYNALEELERKEMVAKKTINNISHYKISDPKILVEKAKKQELLANRLSKNIQTEIKKSKQDHEISVFEGQKKIRKYYLDKFKKTPRNTTVYVLSNFINKFVEVLGDDFFYNDYTKARLQRKIFSKNIASDIYRNEYKDIAVKSKQELRNIKFLPDNILGPIAIIIWDDGICIKSLVKENFLIEIKNQDLKNSYLEHFNKLWKIAKK